MYCINCGAEIKTEDINCPFCGKILQIVPDYSIYDEDDINVILENTIDIQSNKNQSENKTSQDENKETTIHKPVKKKHNRK